METNENWILNAGSDDLTAVICGDAGNGSAVGLTVDYLYVAHTR